jgi:hypothetical protein
MQGGQQVRATPVASPVDFRIPAEDWMRDNVPDRSIGCVLAG